MVLLIAGVVLWFAAHGFKRLAPERRSAMGEKGKAPVAIGIALGLVLMIIGYRQAAFIEMWSPPEFLIHINNLIMVVAVAVFAMAHTKGRMRGRMRHPMLTSVKMWAAAHLLVNGDLASIILFGGMLGWAVWTVIKINRAEEWQRPEPGEDKRDWKFLVVTVVTFAVMVGLHLWLGVSPFGARGA